MSKVDNLTAPFKGTEIIGLLRECRLKDVKRRLQEEVEDLKELQQSQNELPPSKVQTSIKWTKENIRADEAEIKGIEVFISHFHLDKDYNLSLEEVVSLMRSTD